LKKLVSLFIVANFIIGSSFAQDIHFGAALSFGGPIPAKKPENAYGNPLLGVSTGASLSFTIAPRLSISTGLHYSFHGLDYGQSITRDTLITVEINDVIHEVPSYYTSHVNGKIRQHYIDFSFLMGYRIWKMQFLVGPYLSFLLSGKDDGDVRIVIGSGEVFEDEYEQFDKSHDLRKMEYGIMFAANTPLYKNLGIEMKFSRSFITLHNYENNESSGQGNIDLYSTYLQLGLIYKLQKNKE
jgi:hypothetical protein